MPAKVAFRVIYASSADDDHPPSALETHAPTVKGWQSAKYCFWPQELILRLERPARVRKVQILSHQYKIATKIELFYANPQSAPSAPAAAAPSALPAGAEAFSRLGHVSLSDNASNDYRTRELKSVHIDAVALLLRLVVHKNYVNASNLYNQVGIVAVNVIGDLLDSPLPPGGPSLNPSLLPPHSSSLGASHVGTVGNRAPEKSLSAAGFLDRLGSKAGSTDSLMLAGRPAGNAAFDELIKRFLPAGGAAPHLDAVTLGMVNAPKVTAADDMSFDLTLDPETATLVRQLQEQKAIAIASEDYPKASLIKTAIDALVQAGEEMGKLVRFKQRAVEDEDFDTAVQIKEQMTLLRAKLYTSLGVKFENGVAVMVPRQRASTPAGLPVLNGHTHGPLPKTPPLPAIARQPSRENPAPRHSLSSSAPAPPAPVAPRPPSPPIPARAAPPPSPPLPAAAAKKGGRGGGDGGAEDAEDGSGGDGGAPLPSGPPRSPPIRSRFAQGLSPLPADEMAVGGGGGKQKGSDDRPLPAQRAKGKQPKGDAPPEARSPVAGVQDPPEPLSDKARAEAATAIDVFGETTVARIYAKSWAQKVQGLEEVAAFLQSGAAKKKGAGLLFAATGRVIHATIKDKLVKVQQKAAEVVRHVLTVFPAKDVSRGDAALVMDVALPALLALCGDMAARTRETARETVGALMDNAVVSEHHFVAAAVFARLPQKAAPREAQGRMELLAALAEKLELQKNSAQYMAAVAPALMHANKDVRKSAVDAVVAAYKVAGAEVMDMLELSENDTQGAQMLKAVREAVAPFAATPAKGANKRKPVAPAPRSPAPPKSKAVSPRASPLASPVASPPNSPLLSPRSSPRASPVPRKKAIAKTNAAAAAAAARSPATSPRRSPVSPGPAEDADKTCIFCGKYDKDFSEEAMDMHFWKSCPMLKQCKHCKQVVEVSMLRDHWLGECTGKAQMKLCSRCKLPKPVADLASHVAKGTCKAAKKGCALCPLCQVEVKDAEEGWKEHLMGGKCTGKVNDHDDTKATRSPLPSAKAKAAGAAVSITVGGTPSAASREEMLKQGRSPPSTPRPGAKASAGGSATVVKSSKAAAKERQGALSPSPSRNEAGRLSPGVRAGSKSPTLEAGGKSGIPRPGGKK